jgi:sugar lactone lactonase YvrE
MGAVSPHYGPNAIMKPHTFTARPFFQSPNEQLRYLPEGPRVLQNAPGRPGSFLGWVGIQHGPDATSGSINILNLDTGQNFTHDLPGRPGFFAETTTPGLVLIGLERRLVVYDVTTRSLHSTGFAVPENDRVIINDGLAIEGGVLFGTKHLDFNQPIAALYHYDIRGGTLTELVPEQTCSNGKMLIREDEGYTLIDIDSQPKTISRYRLDKTLRTVISRSLVVPPDALPAVPDGLRTTPDGNIVVAFYNPEPVSDGVAWHLDIETGAVKTVWTVPGSPRVTCPEFILSNGEVKILFTTATEGMPDEARAKAPDAGTMFIADTPFATMPSPPPLLDL